MAEHNEKGAWGENLASKHLLKNGFEILERNWTYQKAEIDIIAKKKDLLVVVEVKTRSTSTYGAPRDFISNKKIKHIINAAEAYIMQNDLDTETRFDMIGIITSNPVEIEHIEAAFYPEL